MAAEALAKSAAVAAEQLGMKRFAAPSPDPLSVREREVAGLVAQRLTNKQIATWVADRKLWRVSEYRRRSARVLVVDSTNRVLLIKFLRSSKRWKRGHDWITPGGGVQDGEPLSTAAARELLEEIGLTVTPEELGEPVAYASGHVEFSWLKGIVRDDFFYHRVDAHEVDTSRMEKLELTHHGGHRWWTADELVATTETVYPLDLAPLLTELLAGRVPAEPVRLPWHH